MKRKLATSRQTKEIDRRSSKREKKEGGQDRESSVIKPQKVL